MENTDYLYSEEITDLGPQGPNQTLNVICILGYIGNGIFILFLLMCLMMVDALANMPEMEEAKRELGINNIADFKTYITTIFVTLTLFIIACVVGIIGSHKGKTWGFILYAVLNGIWAIILLVSGDPVFLVFGLISIAFIVTIGLNYKK